MEPSVVQEAAATGSLSWFEALDRLQELQAGKPEPPEDNRPNFDRSLVQESVRAVDRKSESDESDEALDFDESDSETVVLWTNPSFHEDAEPEKPVLWVRICNMVPKSPVVRAALLALAAAGTYSWWSCAKKRRTARD